MFRTRVIPVLLLERGGLYKTVRFRDPTYVGDPINTVRIFNEKEVDELALLDIGASRDGREPDYATISEIAGECFMPLCYGGGIGSLECIRRVIRSGVEKVAINLKAAREPGFVREASERFGSSTIVVSMDVKRDLLRRAIVHTHNGRKGTGRRAADYAAEMEGLGAGELLVTSIDRDGTYGGYDLELVREVASAVSIPVIVCGGARSVADLADAARAGASGVAAGSLFVFQGRHRAVLVNFPTPSELSEALP